ncbi:MAG: DUF6178 family protein [candidate division KSB1 bacterium]|nr:DUF6178 family protein [candidate division KSB1 bacterium]
MPADDAQNGRVIEELKEPKLPSVTEILRTKDSGGLAKFDALPFDQQLQLVLEASGQQRVELLKLADRFVSLVRALPPPELLLTLEEVGIEDCLPIIAATSHEQFTFLTDIYWWHEEELNPESTGEWLQILAECGQQKILDWLDQVDPELLIITLKKTVQIFKCEEDLSPPPFLKDENSFTLDGIYYFQCLNPELFPTLKKILTLFRAEDPEGFRGIMEAVIWKDTLETEDEAHHFRQSRLAEWGFPELDEALEIYQYFTPEERTKFLQTLPQEVSEQALPRVAPTYPIKFQERQSFLATCLKQVHHPRRLTRFCQQLALLANKVQVADGLDWGRLESILISARKVTGYVTLGLAELSGSDVQTAANLIGRIHTERLFQIGFSQVEDLARKARALVRRGWMSRIPGAMELLDSPGREILQGLLKPRPQYYIGDQTLTLDDYQDFQQPDQIKRSWEMLNRSEYQGHLLCDHLGLTAEVVTHMQEAYDRQLRPYRFRLSTLFLTAAARYFLDQRFTPEPLSEAEFRQFLTKVRLKNSAGTVIEGLNPEAKQQLLAKLEESGCAHNEREKVFLQEFVDYCWELLQQEAGNLNLSVPLDWNKLSCVMTEEKAPVE